MATKTYIIKDQGKGTITDVPVNNLIEISGPGGGGGTTGDYIPLTGTEEGEACYWTY